MNTVASDPRAEALLSTPRGRVAFLSLAMLVRSAHVLACRDEAEQNVAWAAEYRKEAEGG